MLLVALGFAAALMAISPVDADMSWGSDSAPDYNIIQRNDPKQTGEVVKKICVHRCTGTFYGCTHKSCSGNPKDPGDCSCKDRVAVTEMYHDQGASQHFSDCNKDRCFWDAKVTCKVNHGLLGLQVWWTDNTTISRSRYEEAGSLWAWTDTDGHTPSNYYLNRGDKNYIQCMDIDVDKGERITWAEIRTGDQIDYIKINTNNPNNPGISLNDNGGGRRHAWTYDGGQADENFFPGSSILCGLSGKAGQWIDQLRYNFLSKISSGTMTDMTWETPYQTGPTGQPIYDSHDGGTVQCGQSSQQVGSKGFAYNTEQQSTVTYEATKIFGWKMSSDITVGIEPRLGKESALAKMSVSIKVSEYSSTSTRASVKLNPITYKASLSGAISVPSVINSKATGLVSITLINTSYATGYFYATNIKQMTAAHLHVGAMDLPSPGPSMQQCNGSISGLIKASFTFNPSLNNISSLLATFSIHTVVYPAGELRGQFMPSSAPSPLSSSDYTPTSTRASSNFEIIEVDTKDEWDELMSKPNVAYIIYFTATWCGPCRKIGPTFEELSSESSTLVFLKFDVDENAKVAEECGISFMPTFQVFKNGNKIDELFEATPYKLEALFKKHQ